MDGGRARRRRYERQRDQIARIVFYIMFPIVVAYFFTNWYYGYQERNYSPAIILNRNTMHPDLYISEDSNAVSNRRYTKFRRREPSGTSYFNKYMGVTLNRRINMDKNMYFEVKVNYKPVLLTTKGFVFEIGFADLRELEKKDFLRNTAKTIYIRLETCKNDNKYFCLIGNGGLIKDKSYKISFIEENKTLSIHFRFDIAPEKDVLKVTWNFNLNKISNVNFFTFKKAGLHNNMWPVFGMSRSNRYKISMKLVNVTDLFFDSSIMHPLIYMSDDNYEIANVDHKKSSKGASRDRKLDELITVLGNKSFDIKEIESKNLPKMVFFKVMLEYNITGQIEANRSYVDIGLGRWPKNSEKCFRCVPNTFAYVVHGQLCEHNKICLYSRKHALYNLKPMAILSSSKVGSQFKGIITFSVDFNDKAIIVNSDFSTVVFDNVDFTQPLWPFFSIRNDGIEVKISLNKSFERPWYEKLYYWLKSFHYNFQQR